MKAVTVKGFCPNVCIDAEKGDKEIEESITISEVDKPALDGQKDKGKIIIKVLACSISAGDTHTLRGNIVLLHPTNGFPFTPGMDVCGVVEEVHPDIKDFEAGQTVVASSETMGGMAEYMKLDVTKMLIKPSNVNETEAASCWSAVTSWNAVMDYVKKGNRVLILGGSGGVGSAAITLAKKVAGASFVAATSTQSSMCEELGADVVINYRKKNWWEVPEYKENKFDVIIDTVGGGNFTDRAVNVLKTSVHGGTFVAVCGDEPIIDANTWLKLIKFFFSIPGRPLYTWFWGRWNPRYVTLFPYNEVDACRNVLKLMSEDKLQIRLDPSCPLSLTVDGAQRAFKVVGSRHAHGKIVIDMGKK